MNVSFHTYSAAGRGTDVTIFKYAYYNEKILGNKSYIITSKKANLETIKKYQSNFQVFLYDDELNQNSEKLRETFEQFCSKNSIDVFYTTRGGEDDNNLPRNVKTAVHCVFHMNEPHGNVYAGISEYLSNKYNNKYPFVDYIVELDQPEVIDDLRDTLSIPKNAIVLGRHGGYSEFNIKWVHSAIKTALFFRKNLWFIFLNTEKFINHKRAIFLPKSNNLKYKAKFVNTSDAMIHARSMGETFGLSIAEFSIRNKPIITYKGGVDSAHVYFLGEKALYYKTRKGLILTLLLLNKRKLNQYNWDPYSERFSPEVVMEKFKKVFL